MLDVLGCDWWEVGSLVWGGGGGGGGGGERRLVGRIWAFEDVCR